MRNYSIRHNRLRKAALSGLSLQEDGSLFCVREDIVHSIFLEAIDSSVDDTVWGRLRYESREADDMVCTVRAFASNERYFLRRGIPVDTDKFLTDSEIGMDVKYALFSAAGGIEAADRKDILLYSLRGRYLWLSWEMTGRGGGRLWDMRVTLPGDSFINTFPEVYREQGSFFHRYLSLFSSIYNDFQEKIENIPCCLDLCTAPEALLPVYAEWLGLDVSGDFLEETVLRALLRETYQLNRIKGTKKALERLTELLLGEKAVIVEKSVLEAGALSGKAGVCEKLYGSSRYDITILVKKFVEEKKKAQMFFLLQQFVPVRCRMHIVYLNNRSTLDTYCYLDVNARTYQSMKTLMDGQGGMDEYTWLE